MLGRSGPLSFTGDSMEIGPLLRFGVKNNNFLNDFVELIFAPIKMSSQSWEH